MKIQAVLIGTFLSAQEKLAEFGGAEWGSDQPLVVNKLVNGENCYCAVPWVAKSHVRAIARSTSWAIVYVICVYYYFLDFSVLAKKV